MDAIGFEGAKVYDISQTFGKPLSSYFTDPFKAEGRFSPYWLYKLEAFCDTKNAAIVYTEFRAGKAGDIRCIVSGENGKGRKYGIRTNSDFDPRQEFVTLAHEAGHLLLGHLGTDEDLKIYDASYLPKQVRELEAESVASLVCSAFKVNSLSERYLVLYEPELASQVRMNRVICSANTIIKAIRKMKWKRGMERCAVAPKTGFDQAAMVLQARFTESVSRTFSSGKKIRMSWRRTVVQTHGKVLGNLLNTRYDHLTCKSS